MAELYLATDTGLRDSLGRRCRKGELFRVRQGVYIDSRDPEDIENTLQANWPKIAQYLFEEPIAVYRTAVELKPVVCRIYLAVDRASRRTVRVGVLQFIVDSGITDRGIEPFVSGMNRSNPPRQLLENLALARPKSGIRKTLGKDWVETQLLQEAQRRGESGLNRLRDEAGKLAPILGLELEYRQLNKMVSAILMTHPAKGLLQTREGMAHVAGHPIDITRLEQFSVLANYLQKLELSTLPYQYSQVSWRNLAFFESYFSNHIEGTRFTIDEVENIVSSSKPINNRDKDSHDVLSHIEIAGDLGEMSHLPGSPEELIYLLKARHGILMAQRPNKMPGEFKYRSNQAGSTVFVDPNKVEGTLMQGFDIYSKLHGGIKKALFIHFMIAECHPFDDGNGRLARIMMNAELVSQDLHKIIIPSVCRDNYLSGLRQASRQNKFRTLIKVLHQLHQYTASINWDVYGEARHTLEDQAANQEPDAGLMIFNKAIQQFSGDYQAS